jgi:pyridoxal phosphate enzyme (YggS family)
VVTEGLTRVLAGVAEAAARAGRDPAEITVVAVSKGHGPEEIMAAYDAGHRDFGENRAQELAAKVPRLPEDIRWHFVGTLQRRKVKLVRSHVTLLHSMDRVALAVAWQRDAERVPPCLLQVNVAGEAQKHGVAPQAVAGVLGELAQLGIEPVGLMVIPPLADRPEDSRQWFDRLRALRDGLVDAHPALRHLSMGMTDDFTVAVEAGATLIRVGRAIFGGAGPLTRPE